MIKIDNNLFSSEIHELLKNRFLLFDPDLCQDYVKDLYYKYEKSKTAKLVAAAIIVSQHLPDYFQAAKKHIMNAIMRQVPMDAITCLIVLESMQSFDRRELNKRIIKNFLREVNGVNPLGGRLAERLLLKAETA